MTHPISDHPLPGIAAGRQRRLAQAGVLTLEDVVAAGVDSLAAIPHIPRPIAQGAVRAAKAVLDAVPAPTPGPTPAPVVQVVVHDPIIVDTPEPEPVNTAEDLEPGKMATKTESRKKGSKVKKTKGDKAMQQKKPKVVGGKKITARIKRSEGLLKDAAKHARKGKKPQRKKARQALNALRTGLKAVRQLADQKKLPKVRWTAVAGELKALDGSMKRLLNRKPTPSALKKGRKVARNVRSRIQK
ncbi:MAG: hypothetical protein AAFV53_07950 [Myxococcota bacterium]